MLNYVNCHTYKVLFVKWILFGIMHLTILWTIVFYSEYHNDFLKLFYMHSTSTYWYVCGHFVYVFKVTYVWKLASLSLMQSNQMNLHNLSLGSSRNCHRRSQSSRVAWTIRMFQRDGTRVQLCYVAIAITCISLDGSGMCLYFNF